MDPLDDFKVRNPGVNVDDVLADVREAFGHLEAAISVADPVRCQPYVSDSFYRSVDSEIRLLVDRGRRRIHAGFEVLDVTPQQARATNWLTVRVCAVSTLEEVDAGSPPAGDQPQFIWSQDVDVVSQEVREGETRWVIAGLGAMKIEKGVSGPVRALDQATLHELDVLEAERAAHDREDEEWSAGRTHAALSFLRLRGVGM